MDVGHFDDAAGCVFFEDLGIGAVGVDEEAGFVGARGLGYADAVGVVLVLDFEGAIAVGVGSDEAVLGFPLVIGQHRIGGVFDFAQCVTIVIVLVASCVTRERLGQQTIIVIVGVGRLAFGRVVAS